jgi:hypothetical protein
MTDLIPDDKGRLSRRNFLRAGATAPLSAAANIATPEAKTPPAKVITLLDKLGEAVRKCAKDSYNMQYYLDNIDDAYPYVSTLDAERTR